MFGATIHLIVRTNTACYLLLKSKSLAVYDFRFHHFTYIYVSTSSLTSTLSNFYREFTLREGFPTNLHFLAVWNIFITINLDPYFQNYTYRRKQNYCKSASLLVLEDLFHTYTLHIPTTDIRLEFTILSWILSFFPKQLLWPKTTDLSLLRSSVDLFPQAYHVTEESSHCRSYDFPIPMSQVMATLWSTQ